MLGDPSFALLLTAFPRDTAAVYSAPGVAAVAKVPQQGGQRGSTPADPACWTLALGSQAGDPPLPLAWVGTRRPTHPAAAASGLPVLAPGHGAGGGTWHLGS